MPLIIISQGSDKSPLTLQTLLLSRPTSQLLAPLETISRPTHFHYHFKARNKTSVQHPYI